MSRPALLVDLEGALFDVSEGADRAVAEAVARYPAIDAPAVEPSRVAALRAGGGRLAGAELVVALLRAAAGGVPYDAPYDALEDGAPVDAVDGVLAARIYREALLGEALYAACTGEPARWVRGAGCIDGERPRLGAAALAREAARGPLVLVTARGAAETLYLLGRYALTDCFTAVVTEGGGAAEAARRLADLGVAVDDSGLEVIDTPEALAVRVAAS